MSDLISRQAAISAICNACGKIDCDKMDKCEKLQLPPANCSEFPNNSDTISRQAAISHVDDVPYIKEHPNVGLLWKTWIESLPSAQPERKKGEWSDGYRWQRCSLCKQTGKKSWNYYPNCGADMRERKDFQVIVNGNCTKCGKPLSGNRIFICEECEEQSKESE